MRDCDDGAFFLSQDIWCYDYGLLSTYFCELAIFVFCGDNFFCDQTSKVTLKVLRHVEVTDAMSARLYTIQNAG
jgi:hypothetical protein